MRVSAQTHSNFGGGDMDNWYKTAVAYDFKPGDSCWFEYHCYEGHDSCDAKMWYHSHQKVEVLRLVHKGEGETPKKRGYNGDPAVYKVRFSDGFEYDAFEDELTRSQKAFFRPDPPRKQSN